MGWINKKLNEDLHQTKDIMDSLETEGSQRIY